jgi:hypothetical protein
MRDNKQIYSNFFQLRHSLSAVIVKSANDTPSLKYSWSELSPDPELFPLSREKTQRIFLYRPGEDLLPTRKDDGPRWATCVSNQDRRKQVRETEIQNLKDANQQLRSDKQELREDTAKLRKAIASRKRRLASKRKAECRGQSLAPVELRAQEDTDSEDFIIQQVSVPVPFLFLLQNPMPTKCMTQYLMEGWEGDECPIFSSCFFWR